MEAGGLQFVTVKAHIECPEVERDRLVAQALKSIRELRFKEIHLSPLERELLKINYQSAELESTFSGLPLFYLQKENGH